MSIGYEVTEDERNFEKDGLTGQVSRFSSQTIQYPCYVIRSTPENPVPEYKAEALKGMLNQIKVDNGTEQYDINKIQNIMIYMDFENNRFGLGSITPSQVKSFLTSFQDNDVVGYFDENTELSGQNLYVLAG